MTRDNKDNCPEIKTTPPIDTPPVTSGRRPLPICDTPTAAPLELITPTDSETTATSSKALYIPIYNAVGTVTCASIEGSGPNGDAVDIPAGSETVLVDLSFLPQPVTARISVDQDEFRSLALGGDSSGLVGRYGMALSNAETVISLIAIAYIDVNQVALDKARAAIDCYFVNETVTATCPEGALDVGTDGIRNPVVSEAGKFTSRVSQADADAQALDDARRLLVCKFPSPAISVSCETAFGMVGITSDAITPPYGISRIADVNLAQGAFVSEVSVADAENMARAYALGLLQCFYLNETLSASCSDPQHLHDRPINYQSDDVGTDVTVPAGYFASSVSQAAANDEARIAATRRLVCEFGNTRVEVICPTQSVTSPDGVLTLTPSDNSPVKSVIVDANTYRSSVSQADADDSALTDATGRLDCLYCNPTVLPKCIDPATLEDIKNGNIQLPLDHVFANGSMDTTTGVPASKYCLSSAEEAVAAAYADAGTLLSATTAGIGDIACLYGNDVVRYKCTSPAIPMGTFDGSEAERTAEVVIGANSITVTKSQVPVEFNPALNAAERAKKYANWLALQTAKSTLQCVFYNEDLLVTCEVDAGKPDVAPQSSGSAISPIVVKAGQEFSEESLIDANEKARLIGKGQLNCFYLSRAAKFLCDDTPLDNVVSTPDGRLTYGSGLMTPTDHSYHVRTKVDLKAVGSLANPVELIAGIEFSTESQADADAKAAVIGVGNLDCFWTNVAVIAQCGFANVLPWNDFNEQALLPITQGDGELSIGKPGAAGHPVFIPGGVYRSTVSRYDATNQVYRQATTALNCVWANTDVTVSCEQKRMADGGVAPWDDTARTSIIATAGTQLSFESIGDANSKVSETLKRELSCVYTHDDQTRNAAGGGGAGGGAGGGGVGGVPLIGNPCSSNEKAVGVLTVSKGTFKATDPDSPTKQAREHIKANQQCVASGASGDNPYGWSVVSLGKVSTPPYDKTAGCRVIVNQSATLRLSTKTLTDVATVSGFSETRVLTLGEFIRLTVYTDIDGTFRYADIGVTTEPPGDHWTPSEAPTPDIEDFSGTLVVYLTHFREVKNVGENPIFFVNGNGVILTRMCSVNLLLDIVCDPRTGKRHPSLIDAPGGYRI
jgi:hypothetical protein